MEGTVTKNTQYSGEFSILAGAMIALVIMAFPILCLPCYSLMIIVHELGHTIFDWLFGYPAYPAFDFKYGGGVAYRVGRSMPWFILAHCAIGYMVYETRKWKNIFTGAVIFAAVYLILAHTKLHFVVMIFMGHGFELAIATVFLYRALSGTSLVENVERPLYGTVGFFIVFHNISFAWSVLFDSQARGRYIAGKAAGHVNDFQKIATTYLHVELDTVVGFFFLCCFLPPIAAYLIHVYFPKKDPVKEIYSIPGEHTQSGPPKPFG